MEFLFPDDITKYNFRSLLKECVIGQQRTSSSKQFVIMGTNYVHKGPYELRRYETLMERSAQLKLWATPLVLHPEPDIILVKEFSQTLRFVKYVNVETTPPDIIARNVKKMSGESWAPHLSYNYIDRNSKNTNYDLAKLNYVLADNKWLYEQAGYNLVLALVHLWILGCGDTAMANILVDKKLKQVYIIDFDESRTATDDYNENFYFSKNPAKSFSWYDNVKIHYNKVADQLESLIASSPEYTDNIKMAQDLLRKYVPKMMKPIKPKFKLVKPSKPINLGQMRIVSVWKSITFSGWASDEIKSGLQKYIRRGLLDKALYCATELYKFGELDGGLANQTNLYNRLTVIAAEDVGLANFDLVLGIIKYRLALEVEDRNFNMVCAIVQQLAGAQKTRIMSHLARVYSMLGFQYVADNKLPLTIDNYKNVKQYNCEVDISKYIKAGDPEVLITLAKIFYIRLSEKDPNCFGWLSEYKYVADENKLKVVKRAHNTTNPMIIIWEMLKDRLHYEVGDLLYKAWQKYEPQAFIRLALARIIYTDNSSDVYNDVSEELNKAGQTWQTEGLPYMNKLLKADYELELDDYVIDMHTSRGKAKYKDDVEGRLNFAKNGAYVANEDLTYHVDLFEKIYINS